MRLFGTVLLATAAIGLGACNSDPSGPDAASLSGDLAAPLMSNGQAKVGLCHKADGKYVAISVGAPAVAAHMAHGDGIPGSAFPDHSGSFTATCGAATIVLDPSTTYYTALAGGGGGFPFDDSCDAGYAAVGLSGNFGNYFGWAALWNHRLECRELRGDGTLGASSSTPPRGPLFGITTNPYSGSCAADGLLTGTNGTNDWNVSQVAGSCASVTTVLAGGPGVPGVGPFTGFGVNAFIPWASPCAPEYVVTGTYGSAGDILDSVGFKCTRVIQQTS